MFIAIQMEGYGLIWLLLGFSGFSVSAVQDGGSLTATVGGAITFPAPVQTTGTFRFGKKDLVVVFKGISDSSFNNAFRDRVEWDNQSGLFTIRELKTEDAGKYTVKNSVDQTAVIYQLTVHNCVSKPQVRVADNISCSVECSVENGREVTLSWYRGEERLNQTSSADLSTRLLLLLSVEGDSSSVYSCVATHRLVCSENATVTIPGLCWVHQKRNGTGIYSSLAGIITGVSAFAIVVVAVLTRTCQTGNKKSEDPGVGEYTTLLFTSTGTSSTQHTKPNCLLTKVTYS